MATLCFSPLPSVCPCASLERCKPSVYSSSGKGSRNFNSFSCPLVGGAAHSTRWSRPPVRALELDQDTLVAISVGVAGLAVGIGIPIFYESQVKGAEVRENDQPCFPCRGTGSQTCRFCSGAGNISVELGGGDREVSKCINCESSGSLTCTTCQGSGVQPRYLDRREYKDDD